MYLGLMKMKNQLKILKKKQKSVENIGEKQKLAKLIGGQISLVAVRVFCDKNKSCEPVRHRVDQIARQAESISQYISKLVRTKNGNILIT